MTPGFYDDRGRPVVGVRIALPGLGLAGYIDFILDTGAESTVIGPVDAVNRLGLARERLAPDKWDATDDAFGLGDGTVRLALLDAQYHFPVVSGSPVALARPVRLFTLTSGTQARPSLLGMDVLRFFDVHLAGGRVWLDFRDG